MFNLFEKNKKEPQNIKEVLAYLKKLEKVCQDNSGQLEQLKEKSKKNLAKIGTVRFNPFPEVGGDQSFSIAILDDNNDGFVITSHYLRDANRVYGKPIEGGKSKYQLSKEEEDAISKATNS
jgi:hypothetical protein